MATFRRFEDIEAWKLARELAVLVYRASGKGPYARDFRLRDQSRAAVLSIMSNIAEGFERDGKNEFIQFLSIAKGSAGELLSQLYVARDQAFIAEVEFEQLSLLDRRCSAAIAHLMRYLRATSVRGAKFRRLNQKPETSNQKP